MSEKWFWILFRFGGFVAFVACEVRMDWVKRDVGFVSLCGMVFGFGWFQRFVAAFVGHDYRDVGFCDSGFVHENGPLAPNEQNKRK